MLVTPVMSRLPVVRTPRNGFVGENGAIPPAGVMVEGTEVISTYLDARVAAGELRAHDTTVPARALFWALVTMHLAQAPQDGFEIALVDVLLNCVRPS